MGGGDTMGGGDASGPITGRRTGTFVAWLGGLLVLAAIAVLAGTALVVRPWAGASEPQPPQLVAEPPPPAVLAAVGDGASELTPEQVHSAIDALVDADVLGGSVSASVVDLTTGGELYDRSAGTAAIPASTIKLVTAATVLAACGPTYQIPTQALAGSEPGEVVLVGGGDPTLARDEAGFYPASARLDLLAEQVQEALGDTLVTRVVVDSSRFGDPVYGPWTGDIPTGGFVGPITALMIDGGRVDPDPAQGMAAAARSAEPDLAAGRAFAALLGLGEDAEVTRGQAPAPPGGAVLGEVRSPPILRLVEIMLETSDNVVAEALARQVALTRGEPATFAGAAAATEAVLADELGLVTGEAGGLAFADGSGLSRENRISAGLLTDLLLAASGPGGADLGGLLSGLAVAGWSGTMLDRTGDPSDPAGQGAVRAKTGTLNGVDALAGVVVTAAGRVLGFAVLADQVAAGHEAARAALDRIPAALAAL